MSDGMRAMWMCGGTLKGGNFLKDDLPADKARRNAALLGIIGSTAFDSAGTGTGAERSLAVEHPTGEMTVVANLNAPGEVTSVAILRTARKLLDGEVFA